MINPVASQAAPVATPGTQADTSDQLQGVNAAVQTTPSEPSDTQNQTQQQQQQPQRWPHRKPMGDYIEPEQSSLDTAIESLNNNLQAWATGLRFDVDPDTQRLVVSLVDSETGDVIRAVPSEAVLQISKMITQFQGNGINTKA